MFIPRQEGEGEHTFTGNGHQNDTTLSFNVLLGELFNKTRISPFSSDDQACHRLVLATPGAFVSPTWDVNKREVIPLISKQTELEENDDSLFSKTSGDASKKLARGVWGLKIAQLSAADPLRNLGL